MAALGEFDLIKQLFAPLARHPGALGLADDAAFLTPPLGRTLVLTKDAIVAGVHFLPDDPPELIARKLVRVNVSDLAAKGAEPHAALLAAAFPAGLDEDWLRRFASGLGEDLDFFGLELMGGDTVATPGPLTLSLTALGTVPRQQGLLRSGARVGDAIWVTGTIGDAALGLPLARGQSKASPEDREHLLSRYRLPQPRITVGPLLREIAHAAMDISDGLVADLGHLAEASGVAAVIEAALVPLSGAARNLLAAEKADLLTTVLTGGDDYEILFTAPASAAASLNALAGSTGVPITRIGSIGPGAGVTVLDGEGREMVLPAGGYRHFAGGTA